MKKHFALPLFLAAILVVAFAAIAGSGRTTVDLPAPPSIGTVIDDFKLPDTDGAVSELGYAFDTLGADGVIVETNAHGVYLGDERLEPVFAELARRRATVLVHPTSPLCWQQTALGRPRPMIEFIFDTARAVTDLISPGR